MCIVYIQSTCKCMIVHIPIVSSDCMATLGKSLLLTIYELS